MEAVARKTILIVEDDPDAALAIRIILQRRGYRVVDAGTAGRAVEAVNREHPDLILLDIGLPDGSGLDVIDRVRSLLETATTPVIVLTGLDVTRSQAIDAGAQDLLHKPVDSLHLVGAIDSIFPE